jgi:hypothetical protein
MTLTWFPRGRWPSPCAGCGKKIPAASRRAHDPATNQFYHPGCAPPRPSKVSRRDGWSAPNIT